MATPSPTQDEEARDKHQREARRAVVIAAFVMGALGHPEDFLRVTVVPLWGNRFRANVQTGTDAASTRIAHSFFLTTDESGQVIESVPAITRLY